MAHYASRMKNLKVNNGPEDKPWIIMSYPQYNGNIRCLIWREGYEDRMDGTQESDEIYHHSVIPEWADHITNELNELDRLRREVESDDRPTDTE